MNLIRKITVVGHSRAVIIPKEWLESIKNKTGHDVKYVKLHLNDVITIEAYFQKEGK